MVSTQVLQYFLYIFEINEMKFSGFNGQHFAPAVGSRLEISRSSSRDNFLKSEETD